MRKIWIVFFVVALVGTAGYFGKKYLFYEFSRRVINPAIKLPGKDVRQYLPQNSTLSYPFIFDDSYILDTFADLGGDLPRGLALDPENTLIVSSTKAGKVYALPDKNADGKADEKIVVLDNLNRPHGLAFDGGMLYVAETDKVVKYFYEPETYQATSPQVLFSLPGGGRHFTRTIGINNGKLYTSVGSSCDVCEEQDYRRASILVSDLDGSDLKTYAKGLRNTVFFTFDTQGRMWGTDMGRDNLGDNIPPDEVNLIEEGKDYGWPYCYGDNIRDSKFKPGEAVSYCTTTQPPKYELQAHVAPLGITFANDENIMVAEHGSWNRSSKVGYKVVKLKLFADNITGEEDFLAGWLSDKSEVLGRPVDLLINKDGNLFITDDYASLVYIYKKSQ
jgi:glucose/arabinose dehydrogenase